MLGFGVLLAFTKRYAKQSCSRQMIMSAPHHLIFMGLVINMTNDNNSCLIALMVYWPLMMHFYSCYSKKVTVQSVPVCGAV